MSVYFIELGQYVKVGFSKNPERRCARLFTSGTRYSKPWDCPTGRGSRSLIGYVPGSKQDEHLAHSILDDFAVGCEFFLNEVTLREYVGRCLAAGRILTETVVRAEGPCDRVPQVEPDPDEQAKLRAAVDSMFNPTPEQTARHAAMLDAYYGRSA